MTSSDVTSALEHKHSVEVEMQEMTTRQETPVHRTTNDHAVVANEAEAMLKPEIVIVTPSARRTDIDRTDARSRNNDACKVPRWLIIIILLCIISLGLFYILSRKQPSSASDTPNEISPPRFHPTSSSSDSYAPLPESVPFKPVKDVPPTAEDRRAVESIKKLHLWNGTMCAAEECTRAVDKFTKYVDRSVNPCDDFYGHVCGNFDRLAAKDDGISSTMQQLRRNVQQELKSIMTEPPKSQDANSVGLFKKYYGACMDFATTKAPAAAEDTVGDLIRELGGWPVLEHSWDATSFNWMNVTQNARQLGLNHDWFVDFGIDGEGDVVLPRIAYPLPDLDIYLQISDDDFREEYLSLMVDVAVHYGASAEKARKEMARVLEFEGEVYENAVEGIRRTATMKKLSSFAKSDNDLSSYGTTTIDDVQRSSYVKHPWLEFVQAMVMYKHNMSLSSDIVFIGYGYFEFLDDWLGSDINKKTAQNYFIWKTLASLVAFLPEELRVKFKVFKLITGSLFGETEKDRSDTCFQSTNLNLFKAVEAEYVRRSVGDDTKNEMRYLLSHAKRQLIEMIDEERNWIDFVTRVRLTAKTREVTAVIGGLDVMFDKELYDKQLGLGSFQFSSDNVIDMFREAQLKRLEEQFGKLYYKYELSDYVQKFLTGWTEINAKYHLVSNTIMLSAATLQDDMYTIGRPNFLNLGAIGTFMSHELAHGVDTSASFYISNGKVIPWLTVKAKFLNQVQTSCIADEYKAFCKTHPDLGLNANGTVSESLADFVGVDLAYRIYQRVVQQQGEDPRLPKMSESPSQLFWMQFASMWCSAKDSKSDLARQLGLDDHAVSRFRVNGPLRSSRYFARDFGCPQKSYMNPWQKCRVL